MPPPHQKLLEIMDSVDSIESSTTGAMALEASSPVRSTMTSGNPKAVSNSKTTQNHSEVKANSAPREMKSNIPDPTEFSPRSNVELSRPSSSLRDSVKMPTLLPVKIRA